MAEREIMPIETKIVRILSESVVVLGAGSSQGVREEMEFLIYELGDEIFDPETKESLGRLEIAKGHVRVIHLQQSIATARTTKQTVRKTVQNPLFQNPMFYSLFGAREETVEIEVFEKLKVQDQDAEYSSKLTVRVGDFARALSL
jgi:hypothetical protein